MEVLVRDIAEAVEAFAPLALQAEYDNSGLQVGRLDGLTRGVLVCLDVSGAVLNEAQSLGCDMVVSHHPVLFSGVKCFTGVAREANLVERAIRKGITLYAAHTNLDFTRGGVSYAMAERLGLGAVAPLCVDGAGREMGAIGTLPAPLGRSMFCHLLKDTFRTPVVRCNAEGCADRIVRVAVCGGSGMELYGDAERLGADAFVTGDAKYHDFQRGTGRMLLADVGHRESEWGAVQLLAQLIRKKIPTFAVHESMRDVGLAQYY